jgi:ATP-dependent Lon protease
LDFEAIVQSSMDEQDSDASRPSLIRTGQLGDVMKESTKYDS